MNNKIYATALMVTLGFASGANAAIVCTDAGVVCQTLVSTDGNVLVTYDSAVMNASGLYNAPTLIDDGNGNIIVDMMATSNFFAQADSGTPSDIQTGFAFLDIVTLNSVGVSDLFIYEGGSYITSGGGIANQNGTLGVIDNISGVDNGPVGGNDYGKAYGAGALSGTGNWDVLGATSVYTAQSGFAQFTTKTAGISSDISVQINNILTADANGGTAFIDKSISQGFLQLGIITVAPPAPVPVPAAAWLFVSALCALVASRRKKN